MEKNKATLITIIILLLIFVPCTIIGINKHMEEKNKNHEFYFNGSLYFYDNDILIGTYKCKTNKCDYAHYNIIGTDEKKQSSLINKQYAFINDGNKIYLEDVKNGWNINEYEELGAYNISIVNNSYITKSNGLWGIISVFPTPTPYLTNKYNEIYLNNKPNLKQLDLEYVIVKEKEEYKILKNKNEFFASLNKIVEFSDELVITILDDGSYRVVDYNDKVFFENMTITKYALYENYIAIWSDNFLEIYLLNRQNGFSVNYISTYNAYADLKLENNKINVYEYDELIDSYEI